MLSEALFNAMPLPLWKMEQWSSMRLSCHDVFVYNSCLLFVVCCLLNCIAGAEFIMAAVTRRDAPGNLIVTTPTIIVRMSFTTRFPDILRDEINRNVVRRVPWPRGPES